MQLKRDVGKEFGSYLESLGLNPITINKYRSYLDHFLEMFDYQASQKFIDNFITLKKFDPNHMATIKHLLDFLKRDDSLTNEEQLEVSKIVILKQRGRKIKREKPILTKDQIKKVIEDSVILGNNLKTTLFKLMIIFQYEMALRVDELCNLNWSMLKNCQKIGEYVKINLPPEITKTKMEGSVYLKHKHLQQYQEVLNQLGDKLKEEVTTGSKTIWFNLSTTWYSEHFKNQVYKILGVNRATHCLRHSKATHLLQEGVPFEQVQKFMRHADPSSTGVYLHQISESLEKTLSSTGN